MRIISEPRGGGKTTKLVKLSARNWIPIICWCPQHVDYVKVIAKELDLEIPDPILFDNIRDVHRIRGRWFRQIYVDDADLLLQKITWCTIEGMSVTGTL